MGKSKKEEVKPETHKIKDFGNTVWSSIKNVAALAFLCATGIAAYVLYFSSDSLTLKVVAGVLTLHAAVQALARSTNK